MSQAELADPQDLELLAGHVLGDLSGDEQDRVSQILRANGRAGGIVEELEATAAGFHLAMVRSDQASMPESLLDQIRAEGRRIVSTGAKGRRTTDSLVDAAVATETIDDSESVHQPGASGPAAREWLAWLCAAAAILLAVGIWSAQDSSAPITARLARAQLLEQSDSVIRVAWTDGKTPFDQAVSGDVVWDSGSQTGFMRFEGMPVNDPTVEQYQLWIIDPERDDEPVDGGVFDISESGEVIVKIDAKLDVIAPAAFAVTIEKPGGVVVSDQARLPLLAAVE